MKVRNMLAFILAIAMVLSVAAMPAWAADEDEEAPAVTEFTDVTPNDAAYKAIKTLSQLGVLNGYPTGEFKPNENMTRAEFCTAMVRYLKYENMLVENAMTGFDDLDTDENYAWARPYVKVAVDNKIVNGFEDGTFRAAEQIKYVEAVKMIVCAVGYEQEALSKMTANGKWYTGYLAQAQILKITSGGAVTANVEGAVSRGIVAMLLYNAMDIDRNADFVTPADKDIILKPEVDVTGRIKVRGIVTGTYITELDDADSSVDKDHIQITVGDEDYIYEVGFSSNPNDFLGCKVTAYAEPAERSGDYDLCTSIEVEGSKNVLEIKADCYHGYKADTNEIEYSRDRDSAYKDAALEEDAIVIYNGKYFEDYDLSELDIKSGTVELINNDSDSRYEVVRINKYEVYVVDTPPTRNNNKIKLMYGATYDGEETLTFPDESTSLVFYLSRNGKEIEPSNLSKWDVLNIKRSPSELDGKRYYEVVVTRETVSGKVTERDKDDFISIGGRDLYIAESFLNYQDEDKPELEPGDEAQVYLDAEGKVVAAAKTTGTTSSEAYAYLLGVRQDSSKSDYELEFWIYTTSGKKEQIGSASKITIDGVKYKADDEDVLTYLGEAADIANSSYGDAENVGYHQPIIYQLNSDKLVSTIYTVKSEENEDISIYLDGEHVRHAGAEERTYSSSGKSFGDFKVSSSTKVIFVPDSRTATDDYLTFSYSKAFTNARKYHVEAFGMTDSKTAGLVLLYHQNDSRIYTSSTPFMIVASKSDTASGTVIRGYAGTSTSLKTVKVSEEDGPSISAIGKGDVIRYILDSSNELIDYQIWFDADDPDQLKPCGSLDEAIDNRILEIHSTSTEPRKNYPSATFRLQYGTVLDLVLKDSDSVDEETITVTPTIVEDDIEMVDDGHGVVARTIGSSVKVFYYDTTARNADVVTDAELSEILPYIEYGESATRVITYSASGTLRMVYIIGE